MFSKGSRYRNLPESSPLDARGERQRGKQLRVIPEVEGRFVHTVREGERLDLLSLRYYGDPTRWWRIADANAQEPYPPDLLDRRPFVAERFVLERVGFDVRFAQLVEDLGAYGQAANALEPSPGERPAPGFLRAAVVVVYPESVATRNKVITEIEAHGFDLLETKGRTLAGSTAESFFFDDLKAKEDWSALVNGLSQMAGVESVESSVVESTLLAVYNAEVADRAEIVAFVKGRGFELSAASERLTRAGARILIPPSQVG
jgi:hypothetical protein